MQEMKKHWLPYNAHQTVMGKSYRKEEEKRCNATCGCSPNKPRCVKLNNSYNVIKHLSLKPSNTIMGLILTNRDISCYHFSLSLQLATVGIQSQEMCPSAE